MNDWIIFTTGRPEFLYGTDCTVVETYHFGEGVGSAAHVRAADDPATIRRWDDRIRSVETNFEVGLRTALDFVTESAAATATIEDVRDLHDVPTGGATGAGQTVVAMDSGVDTSHPLFSDQDVRQVDVTGSGTGDDVGHGTAVLGQITRLAPESELISLRIFGAEGRTQTNVIMRAYEWLHANADEYDVVNMSWGSQASSDQIDRVHDRLVDKGVRDVVAAGNTGERAGSPATADRAFSVGACTESGEIAEFSSYNPQGDNPDVAAIGKDCRLAQASGTTMGSQLSGPWVKASGTSFSAPAVAGMVAKFREARGGPAPTAVLDAFEANARDIPDQPRDGAGLVDYAATVGRETQSAGDERARWPTTSATVETDGSGDRVAMDSDWLAPGEYTVTRLSHATDGTMLHLAPETDGGE
jgi:subtilisin family serine protease